ncbi:hypothetical protein M501DRAFT_994877 [Patellaria atrata CBS 101060]|uniref:Uncharacterized protein n=1 Tax=Patellaria atrata CBS 101060 TaxID=1346257 RepID=A0A9P4S881_9PEZI|nr:hypothetical protein M501DRAFT_994877 [Patellaria atrata CBS 101060]
MLAVVRALAEWRSILNTSPRNGYLILDKPDRVKLSLISTSESRISPEPKTSW